MSGSLWGWVKGKVRRADIEGLFRGADELSGTEYTWCVPVVTVGAVGQAPAVVSAEVPETYQMYGRPAEALDHLFARLPPALRWPAGGQVRLDIGIDVTQRAAKADVQRGVSAGVVFFHMGQDTLACGPELRKNLW